MGPYEGAIRFGPHWVTGLLVNWLIEEKRQLDAERSEMFRRFREKQERGEPPTDEDQQFAIAHCNRFREYEQKREEAAPPGWLAEQKREEEEFFERALREQREFYERFLRAQRGDVSQ